MRRFLKSFRPIAVDFLSTIIFIAIYEITDSVAIATTAGIAGGLAQILWLRIRNGKLDSMQWLSLALVVTLGSATLLTRDPRFVMLKPTIAYAAVACVMLKRGWQSRYLPQPVKDHGAEPVLAAWGYLWSAMYFALAGASLAVAWRFGLKIWAPFNAFVPAIAMFGLFLAQYIALRAAVVRSIRAGNTGAQGTIAPIVR